MTVIKVTFYSEFNAEFKSKIKSDIQKKKLNKYFLKTENPTFSGCCQNDQKNNFAQSKYYIRTLRYRITHL
jgi:hypothetical protein